MFEKLKNKWEIKSNFQFWLVFSIFGVTGTSMLFLKPPIFAYLGIDNSIHSLLYVLLYILIITPIYFIVLLIIGSIFGQFRFFWEFVKKMFSRFGRKKNNAKNEIR
jgi:hypothetical protein